MQVRRDKVSLLFDAAVAKCAKAGVTPTPSEIVWLHQLSETVVCPRRQEGISFLTPPVLVGEKLWLYAPTVQALIWIGDTLSWWDGVDTAVVAFALAHSDGRSTTLRDLSWRPAISDSIRRFVRTMGNVPADAVRAACQRLMGIKATCDVPFGVAEHKQAEETDSGYGADQWGELIAILAGAYHLDPRALAMDYSIDQLTDMLKHMPGPGGIYAKPPPDKDPMRVRANAELQFATLHIINTHKQAEAAGK